RLGPELNVDAPDVFDDFSDELTTFVALLVFGPTDTREELVFGTSLEDAEENARRTWGDAVAEVRPNI
nr:hypothetical protein [Actinomycetota bacterium]